MDNKFTYMSNQILRNMMSIRKGIVMLANEIACDNNSIQMITTINPTP